MTFRNSSLIFIVGFSVLTTFSCKHRGFNANSNTAATKSTADTFEKIKIPEGKDTWLFTWTNEKSAFTNPQKYLQTATATASLNNKMFSEDIHNMAGYGVYFAGDPLVSSFYGDILVAVKAKNGVAIDFSHEGTDIPDGLVRQSQNGILYIWNSSFLREDLNQPFAFVVSSPQTVQMDSAITFKNQLNVINLMI